MSRDQTARTAPSRTPVAIVGAGPVGSYDVERKAVVVGSVSRYTDVITRTFLQTPSIVRTGAFFL